ncbi:MAG: ABC transporter permease [Clostridia bacterium]|nr:ABC transporter permease [Clostridia bacterium]
MITVKSLIKRNTVLFFKDKGMFFTSLITPLILLVLYTTFLGNVYEDSFKSVIEAAGLTIDEKLLAGCVGGQLLSSLLAVSCITVAFCSNLLSVQDKVSGARKDIVVAPVKGWKLSVGYYVATLISTVIICYVALFAGLIYLSVTGWFLTLSDVLLLILDVFLLSLFGTALSSVVNFFLSTQGQISAVGSIVSSCYGFICGAYMPISTFSQGLQRVLSFFPGTYATALLRYHTLRSAFEKAGEALPKELIDGLKDSVDYNVYFFEKQVSVSVMYAILIGTVVLLMSVYILMNKGKKTA